MFGTSGSRSGRKASGGSGIFSRNVNVGANVLINTAGFSVVGNSTTNIVANSSGFYQNGIVIGATGALSGDILVTARAPGVGYLNIDGELGPQVVSKTTYANLFSLFGTSPQPGGWANTVNSFAYVASANIVPSFGVAAPQFYYLNGNWVVPGQNVQSGPNAQIMYSNNMFDWLAINLPVSNNVNFYSAAYGNGVYVVVGQGQICYSSDAQTWINTGGGAVGFTFYQVAYGNGNFVAVGTDGGTPNGVIFTSHNGSSWTQQSIPVVQRGPLNAVYYGGAGYWFAGGNTFSNSTTGGILRSGLNVLTGWTSYFNQLTAANIAVYTMAGSGDANAQVLAVVANGSEYVAVSANGGTGAFTKASNVASTTGSTNCIPLPPSYQSMSYTSGNNGNYMFAAQINLGGVNTISMVTLGNAGFAAANGWSLGSFDATNLIRHGGTGDVVDGSVTYVAPLNVVFWYGAYASAGGVISSAPLVSFQNNITLPYVMPDSVQVLKSLNGNLVAITHSPQPSTSDVTTTGIFAVWAGINSTGNTWALKNIFLGSGGGGSCGQFAQAWDAAYANGLYCFLASNVKSGDISNTQPQVYYSTNLTTWTLATLPASANIYAPVGKLPVPRIVAANGRFAVPLHHQGANCGWMWGNGTSFAAVHTTNVIYSAISDNANVMVFLGPATSNDVQLSGLQFDANTAYVSQDGGNSFSVNALPFGDTPSVNNSSSMLVAAYGANLWSFVWYNANVATNVAVSTFTTPDFISYTQSNSDVTLGPVTAYNWAPTSNATASVFSYLIQPLGMVNFNGSWLSMATANSALSTTLQTEFESNTPFQWVTSKDGFTWQNILGGARRTPAFTFVEPGSNASYFSLSGFVGAGNSIFFGWSDSVINLGLANSILLASTMPNNKISSSNVYAYDPSVNFVIYPMPRMPLQPAVVKTYIKT